MTHKQHPALPGAAKLAEYLKAHDGMTFAELARKATELGKVKVDRVTVSNLVNGSAQRVSVAVAFAIEAATGGEVPAWMWQPTAAPAANAG